MKRIIGIMIGLSLGWIAAGMAFAAPHGSEAVEHAAGGENTNAAAQLTHHAVGGIPFLPLVLIITVGLFGAGLFVHLVGWAKPQPIEDEHDDHGHDAHH